MFEKVFEELIHTMSYPEKGAFIVTDGKDMDVSETAEISNDSGGKNGTGPSDTAENRSAGTKSCGAHEILGGITSHKVYESSETTMSDCDILYHKKSTV